MVHLAKIGLNRFADGEEGDARSRANARVAMSFGRSCHFDRYCATKSDR